MTMDDMIWIGFDMECRLTARRSAHSNVSGYGAIAGVMECWHWYIILFYLISI